MRNRLTIARANIEAFIDGKLAPTPARLSSVLQSLNALEALLKDFVATKASVEAPIRRVEINVCELLERECRSIEAVASAKGVELSVRRDPEASGAYAQFKGDPVRIGEIISNVLLNAVRYTPRGGAIIVDCSSDSSQVDISIADSGPVGGTSGAGHGLAIAKEFVEAHGGSIETMPSTADGARFVVQLPVT